MQRIKAYLKVLIKFVVRFFAKILLILPVKKGQIMFSSYWGEKVSCNPYCVYEYLNEHYPNKFKYIWVYNGAREEVSLKDDVKTVRRFSLSWFICRATSQVVVDNCNPNYCEVRRRGQFVIQTWHAGGAYKKVGSAATAYQIEQYVRDAEMAVVDLFVSSSKKFTEGNIIEGYHYTGEIINCGMPRNDIFSDPKKINAAREKVRAFYKIDGPILLYAPTFRGNLRKSDKIDNVLDTGRIFDALKQKYGNDVNILIRCHHWDRHTYEFEGNVLDAGSYLDMQELLCASDILITDYSSSMWDYALLGRPCLLYVPDVDEYIQNRGFFTPIEQWPGIVCRDMDELCETIVNLNEKDCADRARKHLKLMGSYETGHATEMVCSRIMDYII